MPMVPRNSPGQGVTMVPGGSQATQICMALAIEWPSGTHLASVVAHTLGVCTGPNCSRAAQATQICMALVETRPSNTSMAPDPRLQHGWQPRHKESMRPLVATWATLSFFSLNSHLAALQTILAHSQALVQQHRTIPQFPCCLESRAEP